MTQHHNNGVGEPSTYITQAISGDRPRGLHRAIVLVMVEMVVVVVRLVIHESSTGSIMRDASQERVAVVASIVDLSVIVAVLITAIDGGALKVERKKKKTITTRRTSSSLHVLRVVFSTADRIITRIILPVNTFKDSPLTGCH